LGSSLALASALGRAVDPLVHLVASAGHTFAPVLNVLTRLWLAQVFLRADVM
jgi:hypothetical protein